MVASTRTGTESAEPNTIPSTSYPQDPTQRSSRSLLSAAELRELKATVEEKKLQDELAQIEHNDFVRSRERAALENPTARAQSPRTIAGDDFDSGEQFAPQVLTTTAQFPGVQAKEVSLILYGKLDPISLPKLRNAIGNLNEDLQHLTRFNNSTGRLVLTKARGTYKDFGETPTIWVESFVVYVRIVSALFGHDHPLVVPAMLHFLSRVLLWANSHEWTAVLRLAIDWHSHALSTSQLQPDTWQKVPIEWIDAYISSATLASRAVKRVKSDNNLRPLGDATCNKFNSAEGCTWDKCRRTHKCSRCGSRDHAGLNCRI